MCSFSLSLSQFPLSLAVGCVSLTLLFYLSLSLSCSNSWQFCSLSTGSAGVCVSVTWSWYGVSGEYCRFYSTRGWERLDTRSPLDWVFSRTLKFLSLSVSSLVVKMVFLVLGLIDFFDQIWYFFSLGGVLCPSLTRLPIWESWLDCFWGTWTDTTQRSPEGGHGTHECWAVSDHRKLEMYRTGFQKKYQKEDGEEMCCFWQDFDTNVRSVRFFFQSSWDNRPGSLSFFLS